MMKSSVIVTNPFGLHSRISSNILKIERSKQCHVEIVYEGKSYCNDSILMLLQSGIVKGSCFDLVVDGKGDLGLETDCYDVLLAYIESYVGDKL